jgi:hypothetical protein
MKLSALQIDGVVLEKPDVREIATEIKTRE